MSEATITEKVPIPLNTSISNDDDDETTATATTSKSIIGGVDPSAATTTAVVEAETEPSVIESSEVEPATAPATVTVTSSSSPEIIDASDPMSTMVKSTTGYVDEFINFIWRGPYNQWPLPGDDPELFPDRQQRQQRKLSDSAYYKNGKDYDYDRKIKYVVEPGDDDPFNDDETTSSESSSDKPEPDINRNSDSDSDSDRYSDGDSGDLDFGFYIPRRPWKVEKKTKRVVFNFEQFNDKPILDLNDPVAYEQYCKEHEAGLQKALAKRDANRLKCEQKAAAENEAKAAARAEAEATAAAAARARAEAEAAAAAIQSA